MKKILGQLLVIALDLIFTFNAVAADGTKTIVNGKVLGTEIKSVMMYNRLNRGMKALGVVKPDGQYQLVMNLKAPGFYRVSNDTDQATGFELYLNPGDQITMKNENGKMMMTGKGSGLNQFLYELNQQFPYVPQDGLPVLAQIYNNRVKAIQQSTNGEVIRYKALLLGNEQGEYLYKIYGPLIASRAYPTGNGILEVNFKGLDEPLVPQIVVYPNWSQLITELMNAKVSAGQLKIRNINTWVADFGNAIGHQKLKEDYIAALLESSVSYADYTSINEVIKHAILLVKDPQTKIRINALKSKVAQRMGFYKNAMPGTDFSAFTFQDVDGKQVSVADYKGKIIYIDIWTTGCMPCMAEAPYLKKLEHEMQGKDIVFLSISCDSGPEVWKKTIQKYNLSGGHQLLMNGGYNDPFFEKVGKSGVPRFLILDKEGKMFDYNSSKRPSNPLLKIYLNGLLDPAKS